MKCTLRLLGIAILFVIGTTDNLADNPEWKQNPYNPVLQPSQTWQRDSVFEPSVIYENGRFRMWYSGGTAMCILGYAESADGVNWQPVNGAILGNGAGGVRGQVCRNNVVKIDGLYYLTYSDGGGSGAEKLWIATSEDGQTFTTPRVLVEPDNEAVGIANSSLIYWRDEWWVFYEAHNPTHLWEVFSAHGKTLDSLTKTGKIQALQQSNGGMYGGVNVHAENGRLVMFYHAAPSGGWLPTDIYTATSKDGMTWEASRFPVVTRRQAWWQVDQVADPYYVEALGKQWIFYDGCDNRDPVNVVCLIGISQRN